MKRMITAALLMLVATAVYAEGETKFVAGAAAAFTDYSGDASHPVEDSGLGVQLYAQVRVNSWFALEGGYFSSGEFTTDIDPGNDGLVDISMSGFNASAVGFIPIFEDSETDIDFYGKFGFFDYDINQTVQNGPSRVPGSLGHETGLLVGAGIVLNITDNIGIRTDANYFDISHADMWSLNMGVQIGF